MIRMKPWNFCLNKENVHLLLYVAIAVTSMIGPGMTIGYSAVALPVLTQNTTCVSLTPNEKSWFASLPIILQIFGSLFSHFTMKCGRRLAITFASSIGGLGWLVLSTSCNVPQLLIARAITGFSVGMCASPANIYLAEVSPITWTTLSSWCSVMISTGVLFVFLIGFLLPNNWSAMAAICIIPPALSVVATIIFLPESPRWLLTKSRRNEAKNCLLRIRGLEKETETFKKEFDEMVRYSESRNSDSLSRLEETDGGRVLWKKVEAVLKLLKLPEIWKPLVILNFYFFCQQFCGLYVVSTYTVDIVEKMHAPVDPFLITVLLGAVQAICGIIHVSLSVKIGRRPFSIISSIGSFISLIVMLIHLQIFGNNSSPTLQLVCIFVFMAACSFGVLIAPWAMIGELYPTKYVNTLSAITTGLASFYNFIAVYLYPIMAEHDMLGVLYLYTAVALITVPFVIFTLPETLGKSRDEIEENFGRNVPAFNR